MFYSLFCEIRTHIFIPRISATSQSINPPPNHVAVRYASKISSNENSFTVSYLINSCGLPLKSALVASEKIQIESPSRPDSVITFLKNYGFSQTQIRKLIEKKPKFLFCNPDETFLPKFHFFYSRGISSSVLAKVLSSNPQILTCSLHNCIIPNFYSFKDFTHCDDNKVIRCYLHCTNVLTSNFLSISAAKRALLQDYGVPKSNITSTLLANPRLFLARHDKFVRMVKEVKKFGINPSRVNFVVALQVLAQMSESTWDKKCNVFKQWGWSDEDIASAFAKFPWCMSYSEHNITTTMDYLVNTMGLKSSYLVNNPFCLGFSLKRRIIPRCSVIQVLSSKGLIDKFNLYTILQISEEKFLQTFVSPYNDPYLLKLYKEKQGHVE